MKTKFSTLAEPNKTLGKREMNFEFKLLADIVAKPLMEKSWSFDTFTSEIFLIMNAILLAWRLNDEIFFFKI